MLQVNSETDSWRRSDVREAFGLFVELLRKGEIDQEGGSLFHAYRNEDIKEIIEEVIEKQANVKIFAADNKLYMVPNVDNTVLSFSNQELRDLLKLKNNEELYLFHFTVLTLISKFYNSNDGSMMIQDYVTLTELWKMVDEKIQTFAEMSEDQVDAFLMEDGLDVEGIVHAWQSKVVVDEKAKDLTRTRKNQVAFIDRAMRFLDEQGLIDFLERKEIKIKEKMKQLITGYYYNAERKEQIMSIVRGDGEKRDFDAKN